MTLQVGKNEILEIGAPRSTPDATVSQMVPGLTA
jgi:hypothetical protein